MIYANPNTPGAVVNFRDRYDNFIGGQWVPPVKGQYFDNVSPVNGQAFCQVARSSDEDIELALDAAQQEKVEAIYAAARPEFMKLRELPEDQRPKARERVLADVRAKVGDVLTPEQRTKAAEMRAKLTRL